MRHSRFPLRHFRVSLLLFLLLFTRVTRCRVNVTPSYALRAPRNPGGYASEYTRARARTGCYARARARLRQGRTMCIANRITCTHIARIAHRFSRTPARFLSLSLALSLVAFHSQSSLDLLFLVLAAALSPSRFFLHLAIPFPVLPFLLLFLSETFCIISFHLYFFFFFYLQYRREIFARTKVARLSTCN